MLYWTYSATCVFSLGTLGHTANEDPEKEAEVYDIHKSPLKRVKTVCEPLKLTLNIMMIILLQISISAGCSFGKPNGTSENSKSKQTISISDVTRRRIMKRSGYVV